MCVCVWFLTFRMIVVLYLRRSELYKTSHFISFPFQHNCNLTFIISCSHKYWCCSEKCSDVSLPGSEILSVCCCSVSSPTMLFCLQSHDVVMSPVPRCSVSSPTMLSCLQYHDVVLSPVPRCPVSSPTMLFCLQSHDVVHNFIKPKVGLLDEVQTGVYRVSRGNVPDFGRMFLTLKYTYIPQNSCVYPKLNGYGDNGERSLKVWQLLHTYWLLNTY